MAPVAALLGYRTADQWRVYVRRVSLTVGPGSFYHRNPLKALQRPLETALSGNTFENHEGSRDISIVTERKVHTDGSAGFFDSLRHIAMNFERWTAILILDHFDSVPDRFG